MNHTMKTAILETIKRAHIVPRTFETKPSILAYHAEIPPFFLRIQRTRLQDAYQYVFSAHGVQLTPFVTVPDTPRGFVSADMVDLPEIWHAMEEKYQAQQRDVPMDQPQQYWTKHLNKFIAEYDATRALERTAISRGKNNGK